jgi:hypothetical protein
MTKYQASILLNKTDIKKTTTRTFSLILTLFLGVACTTVKEQPHSFLVLQTNTSEEYAYTDSKNRIVVPYGRYSMCLTDTIKTIGFVMKSNHGCWAIDNKGKELFRVYVVDNGNDFPSEGVFRILDQGGNKIGFADMNGKVIVPPRYDAAFPFSEGMAAVGNGTEKVDISNGEGHCVFKGGKWGFINLSGEEVIPLEYDSIASLGKFKDGKAEVWKNNQGFMIDKSNEKEAL